MAILKVFDDQLDEETADVYARLFHALADGNRIAILHHLASGPHRVRDLVEHIGFAQSTVSKHLACLRECGLVDVRTQGRASWFSLTDPQGLGEVLDRARAVLSAPEARGALTTHLAQAETDHGRHGNHATR